MGVSGSSLPSFARPPISWNMAGSNCANMPMVFVFGFSDSSSSVVAFTVAIFACKLGDRYPACRAVWMAGNTGVSSSTAYSARVATSSSPDARCATLLLDCMSLTTNGSRSGHLPSTEPERNTRAAICPTASTAMRRITLSVRFGSRDRRVFLTFSRNLGEDPFHTIAFSSTSCLSMTRQNILTCACRVARMVANSVARYRSGCLRIC
mmetsp:Transcript_14853/g.29167  ORF Transcript_14853/g.29167 Transcript_14853/m.29167 type:complete len:208 (+) Transcript_14853:1228-1851(+)